MRVFQTELLNFYYRNLSVLPDYAGYYGYFDSARDRTKVRDIEVIALFTVQLATVGLRQSGLRWAGMISLPIPVRFFLGAASHHEKATLGICRERPARLGCIFSATARCTLAFDNIASHGWISRAIASRQRCQ